MDNLNNIPNAGNWGDAADKLNDNFNKVNIAVETINSKYIKNKGYFPTLAALQAAFPSPKIGDIAYVANEASSSGYYVANVVSGIWAETTTVAPAISINANEYAKHGYDATPKTLKQVDDEIVQLAGDIISAGNIELKVWLVADVVSQLSVGEYGYNTSQKLIYKKISQSGEYISQPPSKAAVYTYNGIVYKWDGDNLIYKPLENNLFYSLTLENGSIDSSNGELVDRDTRVRSANFINGFFNLSAPEGFRIRTVYYYNFDLEYDSSVDILARTVVMAGKQGCVSKVVFTYDDSTVPINVSDIKPENSLENLKEEVLFNRENSIRALAGTTDLADLSKDLIKNSTNLFNHNNVTVGFSILADGTISENANYSYSDYIAVKPTAQYSMTSINADGVFRNAFIFTSYYDYEKKFIKREFTPNKDEPEGVRTITIPDNAYYVRFNITDGSASQYKRQFNEGNTALPYEPYYREFTGIKLGEDVIQQIGSELQITKSDNVMIDIPVDGVFSTSQTWDGMPNFRYTTAAQVYQMFDELMNIHPEYITKQFLGNDGLGNPISLYKFIPFKPESSMPTHYPKIFLTAGVHGYEHVSTLASYLMLEQICNNWQSDELLEALRFNVELLIIPVVNPSGWDAYTRVNHNGVDINRNFPEGWTLGDVGSPNYGGQSAASELETQYIMTVFDQNDDIDIMYDFHNFHGVADDPRYYRFIWVPSGSIPYVHHMAQVLISRMTRKWRDEYDWFPTDTSFFAGWTDTTHGAMVQDHAIGRGIKFSATFEVCERWWVNPNAVPYDVTHKKTIVESIVNWLLINLNELKRL